MRATFLALLIAILPLAAQAKPKGCEKYFSVQWVNSSGHRFDGMVINQLKWWDKHGAKKFSTVCEGGLKYIIVMSDSSASWQMTTYTPVQQTATTSGTVTDSSGQQSGTYSGVIYGPVTYVPSTTTTTWMKVAFSVFKDGQRLRTDEVSGFWNSDPYRKALDKALDIIRKDH